MLKVIRRISTCVAITCIAALVVFASVGAQARGTVLHSLAAEDYIEHRPNELGRVPVFMYHNIVPNDFPRDPSVDEYMYRTYDQFWSDMLWLYEHNFYLVGMNDLISGHLDVPLGKHPVVFTFDDSSSLHFSMYENEGGQLEIDPNCAVGIMERFYAEYPGFGRGAHFGLVPAHKFSWPQHEEDDYFDAKIQWLIDNGYELGNHTLSHPNLAEISDDDFAWTVSGPVIWADATIGVDHPSNASRVLTLPYGIKPKPDDNPAKASMIVDGFDYDGVEIQLTGVLELTGGSSEIPWSNAWDPFSIPRLPVQDDVMQLLKDVHLAGEHPYYTSDGDPDTVTIPWPLPQSQWGKLDAGAVEVAGKSLVKYHPDTGRFMGAVHRHSTHADLRYIWMRPHEH